MRLVVSQAKEMGAGMVRLPVPDIENYFDDLAATMALHKMAVDATEELNEAGFEGPYSLLVCGSAGEIFGRFPAGRPARFLWQTWEQSSSEPDGYLTGLDAFGQFGEQVRTLRERPVPIGTLTIR